MTRREEIRRAGGNYEHHMLDADQWPDMETDFIHGAEWADEHPKSPWIPVEDKLPKYNEEVLVAYGNNDDICFNYRTKNESVYVDKDGWCIVGYGGCVTHWMPIPRLPIKED